MSTKENAAVSQLLALLEARYALRVLWALRDGHAQTFRLLQDSVGGITPNTLNTRIKELREAGIVGHGSDGYSLTLSKKTGQIVRDPADVKPGDTLTTRLAKGEIQSRVEDTKQLKLFE